MSIFDAAWYKSASPPVTQTAKDYADSVVAAPRTPAQLQQAYHTKEDYLTYRESEVKPRKAFDGLLTYKPVTGNELERWGRDYAGPAVPRTPAQLQESYKTVQDYLKYREGKVKPRKAFDGLLTYQPVGANELVRWGEDYTGKAPRMKAETWAAYADPIHSYKQDSGRMVNSYVPRQSRAERISNRVIGFAKNYARSEKAVSSKALRDEFPEYDLYHAATHYKKFEDDYDMMKSGTTKQKIQGAVDMAMRAKAIVGDVEEIADEIETL